nr:ABCG1-2 protein [Diaphanosoma celebensis]
MHEVRLRFVCFRRKTRSTSAICKMNPASEVVEMKESPSTKSTCGRVPNYRERRPAVVNIRFQDVSYYVKSNKKSSKKYILKSLSGHFRSGELTAIMGPSGAGKSSLMNIMAGLKQTNVEGEIQVNGVERNARTFRKLSCYIMQRDELCPELTVLESTMFATCLKLGNRLTREEKQSLVADTLENLGLKGTENTRTSNLSGGERRRLSIALELVNNPPVMFFDEPTSGLDSSSCIQCIALLKRLAQSGRTIVCIIHQPSSMLFETFDRLYLLAEGQCLYRGLGNRLVDFFSSRGMICPNYYNPADYAIDVAVGRYGRKVTDSMIEDVQRGKCDIYDPDEVTSFSKIRSSHAIQTDAGLPKYSVDDGTSNGENIASLSWGDSPTPFWMQFNLLLRRTFICISRDLTLTRLRLGVQLVVGVLIGMLYFGIGNDASKVYSNTGALFFSLLFHVACALQPTVMTFPLEMPILIREHLNNWYSLKAYYLAKTVADIPSQILYPALYCTIVYFMTGQPLDPVRFLMFVTMCVLISLVAQSCGLIIGAVLDLTTAVFIGPVSTIPIFLFSGFFVTFAAIPVYFRWIASVVYVSYAFEGTMQSIYGYGRPDMECTEDYCHFRSPAKYLNVYGIRESVYWIDVLVLLGCFFVTRFATFFVLQWNLRSRK